MPKPVAFVGALIIAVIAFFFIFTSLGGNVPGMEGSSFVRDSQMRGCKREIAKTGAEEWQQEQACTCAFNEFENRGLGLMDAMAEENFDEMSEIMQVCASRAGVGEY